MKTTGYEEGMKLSAEGYVSKPERVVLLWLVKGERLPLRTHLYARRN